MKRILGISLAAAMMALSPATPASAQNALDQFEVSFQAREAQRRALISSTMAFTEEEAAVFWPIYDQYRLTEKGHHLRRLRLVQYFSQHVVGIDTDTAQEIMDKSMAIDADQHATHKKFFADVAPHLSGARYFRLFQIETRLMALFRAGWTKDIPLAVTEEELEMLQQSMQARKEMQDNASALPPTT